MFKKNSASVSAFFLTTLILLFAFWSGGLYPFGWSSISWCDMNQQLIPLFCDFKDILSGDKSLFLNLANAGGMNFYGVFCFFLCSPFTFTVALVDKSDIPFLMNILVVLKLSLAGLTSAFVLKKLCKNLNNITATALGVAYALCGYGMLFYQNIMWLDIEYLFPFIVLGAYKLINQGKPLTLTVTLALSVIFNFYISFAVFIFVILFFGVFLILNPKADKKIFLNLFYSGVLSLLCSAVVWLPSLLQYFASARSGGFIDNLKNSSFFAPYDTTLTILLCSGTIFGGLIFLLPRLSLANKEIKGLFSVFLLTAIPLIVEPINLMWHTGSYMSFPARYGFITVFIGILLIAKDLENIRIEQNRKTLGYILGITAIFLSVFALMLTLKNTETLSAYVNSLWGDRQALKGQVLVCSIFAISAFIFILSLKKGYLKQTLAGVLLCLVVALQGFGSANVFMLTAKDSLSIYNYQSIIHLKDQAHRGGFYRVNTKNKITEANMIGAAGFNSLGHYTSLNDKTYMETARLFGYSGYWMETENWNGNILSDALLSVGYTAQNAGENYTLTVNPYYLGLGVKCDGNIPATLKKGDRLTILGEAFQKMTKSYNPVIKYTPLSTKDCYIKQSKDGYTITAHNDSAVINYSITLTNAQTLYFDAYNGFSTNLVEDINNTFEVYVNGKLLTAYYPSQKGNGVLELGNFENKTVDITIVVTKDCQATSFGVFGIDQNKLGNFVSTAKTLNLKENGNKIEGKITPGNYFISLPYKDNYNVTINGKKIDYAKALNGFIAIKTQDSGILEISFIPKGFILATVISVIGIVLLILVLKFKFAFEKLSIIIYGAFIGGFAGVVLWVYIIPVIVKLKELAF